MLKADNPELQERAAKAAANELTRILLETNPKSLEKIAKELSNKKTFKGILKDYIPKGFESIIKAPISPQVIAVGANIPGGQTPSIQAPSMEVLLEKLKEQQ